MMVLLAPSVMPGILEGPGWPSKGWTQVGQRPTGASVGPNSVPGAENGDALRKLLRAAKVGAENGDALRKLLRAAKVEGKSLQTLPFAMACVERHHFPFRSHAATRIPVGTTDTANNSGATSRGECPGTGKGHGSLLFCCDLPFFRVT
jgi:hypothetical protein